MSIRNECNELWPIWFQLTDHLREASLDHYRNQNLNLFRHLTLGQFRAFRVVKYLNMDDPRGASLKTVASRMKVSPATASELIDSLVKKGVLFRQPCPEDRRSIRIFLTPETKRQMAVVHHFFDAVCDTLTSELTDSEFQQYVELSRKIFTKIQPQKKED